MDNPQKPFREMLRHAVGVVLGIVTAIGALSLLQQFSTVLLPYLRENEEILSVFGFVGAACVVVVMLLTSGAVGGVISRLVSAGNKWLISAVTGIAVSSYAIVYYFDYPELVPPQTRVQFISFFIVAVIVALGAQLGVHWTNTRPQSRK